MIPLFLIVSLSLAAQTPGVEAYLPMLTPSKRVEAAVPESGLQGRVHLLVTVDHQSQVKDAEVLFSTSESLNPLAISAMRQWQFNPVLRNGKPVMAYTDEIVSFHTPGKKFTSTSNIAVEMSAYTRLAELRKKFPRSDQQVLADFEQEASGASPVQRSFALPKLAKAAWQAGATAIKVFPVPVSVTNTVSGFMVDGRNVKLAIPPMLSIILFSPLFPKIK